MGDNIFVLGTLVAPLACAVLALLFAKNNTAQRVVGLVSSIVAWIFGTRVLVQVHQIGVQTYESGNWSPPYGIVLVADSLGGLFAFMVTTIMIGGMLYTLQSRDRCVTYPTFVPLFLLMEVGLVGAMLTGDLFTLFVFMELMVLASVSLTAISDDQFDLEAALKYIQISSMGTLFLLLGIAAMYAALGTLNMADMARILLTGERPFLAPASALMLLCAFFANKCGFPLLFLAAGFPYDGADARKRHVIVNRGKSWRLRNHPTGHAALYRGGAFARTVAGIAGYHRRYIWKSGRAAYI